MLLTVVITIEITGWLAMLYKIIMVLFYHINVILYLSGTSVAIFIAATLFMSFYFSCIFAIQSTKVEIVSYLKTE